MGRVDGGRGGKVCAGGGRVKWELGKYVGRGERGQAALLVGQVRGGGWLKRRGMR